MVNGILVLSPAPGLILLAMTEAWLYPAGQLASPGACDCCLQGLEGTHRKHTPYIGTLSLGALYLTSHMCSWKIRRSRCVSWDITPWLPPGNLARSLSFSSLALGHKERDIRRCFASPYTAHRPSMGVWTEPFPVLSMCYGWQQERVGRSGESRGVTEGKGTNHIKAETGE